MEAAVLVVFVAAAVVRIMSTLQVSPTTFSQWNNRHIHRRPNAKLSMWMVKLSYLANTSYTVIIVLVSIRRGMFRPTTFCRSYCLWWHRCSRTNRCRHRQICSWCWSRSTGNSLWSNPSPLRLQNKMLSKQLKCCKKFKWTLFFVLLNMKYMINGGADKRRHDSVPKSFDILSSQKPSVILWGRNWKWQSFTMSRFTKNSSCHWCAYNKWRQPGMKKSQIRELF